MKYLSVFLLFLFTTDAVLCSLLNYTFINLPIDHLAIYFSQHEDIARQCANDPQCPYHGYIDSKRNHCWGYEPTCKKEEQRSVPHCPGDHRGWVKTKKNQEETFFTQADFGYVRQQMEETQVICEATFPDDSSLECSQHMRFCRGRNLMINFTDLAHREEPLRYKMDVLKHGQIGGYCKLHEDRLHENADHLSPLQSWGPEMRFFAALKERPIVENKCDYVIDKPTYIMKIDATVNMYHHFCDFLNLYASQHLNSTHFESFSQDVNILIWETYNYQSNFKDAFKAFTTNPLLNLNSFRGDNVCFKNIVFPLLPRMIFGLYYNTPIIYGCEGSALFKAFSEHLLHRLEIVDDVSKRRKHKKVRVLILGRNTKYRRVMNGKKMLNELQKLPNVEAKCLFFDRRISFAQQLRYVHETDVLISMHGAGLTHSLFLPDWAAVFELYNCEDPNCYADLVRLRGLKYVTWENAELLTRHVNKNDKENEHAAHAKFANYTFDMDEFMRLAHIAIDHVSNHPAFIDDISDHCDGDEEKNKGTTIKEGTYEPIEFDESIEADYDFAQVTIDDIPEVTEHYKNTLRTEF